MLLAFPEYQYYCTFRRKEKNAVGRFWKQWQFASAENTNIRLFNTMQMQSELLDLKLKDKDDQTWRK